MLGHFRYVHTVPGNKAVIVTVSVYKLVLSQKVIHIIILVCSLVQPLCAHNAVLVTVVGHLWELKQSV